MPPWSLPPTTATLLELATGFSAAELATLAELFGVVSPADTLPLSTLVATVAPAELAGTAAWLEELTACTVSELAGVASPVVEGLETGGVSVVGAEVGRESASQAIRPNAAENKMP